MYTDAKAEESERQMEMIGRKNLKVNTTRMSGCCLAAKSCLTLWTLWTVTCQDPLSLGFPRQEYWSRCPFPSLGDLPNPGMEPVSSSLAGRFFTILSTREALNELINTERFWYRA